MKSLDKFRRKMSLSGSSLRDENIFNSRMFLEESFKDDASYASGIYLWELGKESYEEENQISIRFFKREYSAANGVRMKFQTLNNMQINIGDILYDSVHNEYFICTESFDIDGIHYQGKLTLCNWMLKWQNAKGEILVYPCNDMNTTQYNSGEQSNRQFTIGSSQHMLMLPYDENTVILKTPKRFFLDRDIESPTAFIVTQNDTTSYALGKKGIVRVTVTECPVDPDRDRIDLGLCDYLDEDDLSEDTGGGENISKSTISYDTTIIKSGGDKQTFIAKFFDENGNVINHITPIWNIICDFQSMLDITYDNNAIIIGVDDDSLVDEEFKLVLSDDRGMYVSSLIIRIESLI